MLCVVLNQLSSTLSGDLVEVRHVDHIPEGRRFIFKTDCLDLKGLKELAKREPEYIDVDHSIEKSDLLQFYAEFPHQKIILSYHDFEKTPADLEAVYKKMQQKPAALYKIATFANSSVDTVRMLHFVYRSDRKVIGISMGPLGSSGRVLGPIVGNPITYAPLSEEEATAPGQIPLSILLSKFHFDKLSEKSSIFGLIGDPVDKSLGERVHNQVMKKLGVDGVYVNFKLSKKDFGIFLYYAMRLPFKGISVTMPLKQVFGEKPINTLIFEDRTLILENTDGDALVRVLGEVSGKEVVIIGAGGSAKAILASLKKAGAKVTVINRTVEKAKKIDPSGKSLSEVPHHYDILINCTPHPLPIDPDKILPNAIVVDIKTTEPLPLLEEALKKGCSVLSGRPMFLEQAVGQFIHWLPNLSPNKVRAIMNQELVALEQTSHA